MAIDDRVILCSDCDGEGTVEKDTLVNHHRGEYETEVIPCHRCNATGRLREKTKITISQFKSRTYKVQS